MGYIHNNNGGEVALGTVYFHNMPTIIGIAKTLVNLFTSARFVVSGNSMAPTLETGQWVLAVRPTRSWNRLQRGDIVVLNHPVWPQRTVIKRIIGVPDEEIRWEGEWVYVNGLLLGEEYVGALGPVGPGPEGRRQQGEWWNGPDDYFVLGDNRQHSEDSRAFGPVDRRLILGRVWFRCWPLRDWGALPGRCGFG